MSEVADTAVAEMPAPIVFTDSAAAKVADLIAEEGNPDLKLRVFVQGGGCSGFQYRFGLADGPEADDLVVEQDGATLVVDPVSLDLVAGSVVDYVESLGGAAFKVENPNAASGCGCGSSFAI